MERKWGKSARIRQSADRDSSLVVRRIYGNLGRLVGGKAGAGIISLVYMIIAIRVLGPADYGVLILVHTFAMTVGGIVEFPGWHAVVRYGAQTIETNDVGRLVRLLRFAAVVEIVSGGCAIVTAAALAPIIGPRLGWSSTAIHFALPYSLAVLASIRATAAGYLQLRGRFDLLSAHVLVSPSVRLAGAAGIWWFGGGLHAFLVVWLTAALIEWAVMWGLGVYVFRQTVGDLRLWGTVRGARQENPGIWRFMAAANADATLSDLAPRLPPLIVGWMAGPVGAALYAVAQRASGIVSQPAQLLGQAAYAELARLAVTGERGAVIRQALFRSAAIALLLSLPFLALIMLAPQRVSVFLGGTKFAAAGAIMVLLAGGRVVSVIAPPASAALVALGRPALSVQVNLATTLGLLPLLPLFMNYLGLPGAGWHALLQSTLAASFLVFLVLRESRTNQPVALR